MLDVNLSDQTLSFLWSLLLGAALGFVYIFLKCIRKAFKNIKVITVLSDVIFMLIFAFVTCLFSIGFTQGFVRYYVVAGEVLGFLAFKFTLGIVFYKLFDIIFMSVGKIIRIFQKNIAVFLKKLLKARHNMLYNKVNKKTKSAN